MRLFNCTLLIQRSVLFLLAVASLFACKNASRNNSAVDEVMAFQPELFMQADTMALIRKEILGTTPLTQAVSTKDGLNISIPLFYYYEESTPDITLPFLEEWKNTGDNETDDTASNAVSTGFRMQAYDLIPTLSDKYDFTEKVVIADTAIKNEDLLSYFKENNYDRVEKLIYEDATNYIGVGSFDAIIVFSFSSDTTTGKRFFYYAKCKPEGLSKKETVRLAFQLAQHGQYFLNKHAVTATAQPFRDHLNEVQYKIVDKTVHSLQKEAAVFLDEKSYVSYKLFPQGAMLHLLPASLSGPITGYISSLPQNQATPVTKLAELCDAVDMNFINFWREESIMRTPSSSPDSSNIMVLEVTPSSNWNSIKRYHLLAPVTKNNKQFLLWLDIRDNQVSAFDKAAYTQLIQLIQSKI